MCVKALVSLYKYVQHRDTMHAHLPERTLTHILVIKVMLAASSSLFSIEEYLFIYAILSPLLPIFQCSHLLL